VLEVLGDVHPSNLAVGSADHQHDWIGLFNPILGLALFLDREDFFVVAFPLSKIRIARFELQVDSLAAGFDDGVALLVGLVFSDDQWARNAPPYHYQPRFIKKGADDEKGKSTV